jgi:steroid delta-isomerase-like uncharacterized protein
MRKVHGICLWRSGGDGMSLDNKEKIALLFEQILNGNRLELLDDLIGAAYRDHNPVPGQASGAEGIRNKLASLHAAFPDLKFQLKALVSEGDLVAARYVWEGTHQGTFGAIPPTGRSVQVSGMDFYRFSKGKLVEHWDNIDQLGLLRQLGVIPG